MVRGFRFAFNTCINLIPIPPVHQYNELIISEKKLIIINTSPYRTDSYMHERNHCIVSMSTTNRNLCAAMQSEKGGEKFIRNLREPRYTESEVHRRKLLSSRNRVQYLAQRVKGIVERNGGGATG